MNFLAGFGAILFVALLIFCVVMMVAVFISDYKDRNK